MATILKEMRIAQLCSKSEQTLGPELKTGPAAGETEYFPLKFYWYLNF